MRTKRTKRTNQTNPKRLPNLLWLLAAACALVIFGRGTALASETSGGRLEALIGGERVALPVFKTDMSAHLQGDLATVRLTQVFQNSYSEPLHARMPKQVGQNTTLFRLVLSIQGTRMHRALH